MMFINKELVTEWIPIRDEKIYKNKLGRCLCIGGNSSMGGAIILSAGACLNAGAGLVSVATSSANRTAVLASHPELMCFDFEQENVLKEQIEKADTLLIGPGLGLDDFATHILNIVLDLVTEKQTLIIDADAITLYAKLKSPSTKATLIMTPHLGEWERLTGITADTNSNKIHQEARNKLDAIIVLKSHRTKVFFPQEIWQNTTGNPSMATGGMGDTLAGMICGFIKQYDNLTHAVLSAVYIHSYIGDKIGHTAYVSLPSNIIQAIPTTMQEFVNTKQITD